jgi:thioredoxin-related protein
MRRTLPVLLTLLLALTAAQAGGIAWHEGDVPSAFELAREEQKPIFLYWGAVWCPPCNQIKKTIFTQREFIEKSKLFVPVYLDGDTESAQVWGEKLDVWGYPTMLVMSPEGREIMRMPTGLQVEEFNRVLDQAMARLTPIDEVLAATLEASNAAAVPADSYRLLAYYSWGQNRQLEFTATQQEQNFRRLAAQVPNDLPEEASRLYLLWLDSAISLAHEEPEKGQKRFKLTKSDRAEADRRLRQIMGSPVLTLVNLEFLTYYSGDVIPALHPKANKARQSLIDLWLKTMERVETNDALSVDERLSALFPAMDVHDLEEGEDAPYGEALLERIRARVVWTDRAADDHYTRQASMSGAGYILRRVGLDEEAKKLYLAEVEKSETPWYFMSSLSSMAREAEDSEQAVYWLAQAYETSKGRATRFQWGTSYLIGLMDLVPEDGKRIREESERVFKELLALDDAFAGRNNSRIKRLAGKYSEWNATGTHSGEISGLREALLPSCGELSDDQELAEAEEAESLQARCAEFFTTLGSS